MNPIDRVGQMKKVHEEALNLFKRKNQDYGDSFARYGPIGVVVRLGDKIERLSSITRTGITMVNDESVRDTLIDLHNYAAMAIMLMDEDEKKEDWLFVKIKKKDLVLYQNLIIQLWEMLHLIFLYKHHHLKCYLFLKNKMKHILVYLDQLMLTKKEISSFFLHKT